MRIVRASWIGFMVVCITAPALASAEPPTLEQVYQMVLELQKDQARLEQEAANAQAEAAHARAEASEARAETTLAKEELARAQAQLATVSAEIQALPDVAAAEPAEAPADSGAFLSFDMLYWGFDGGREYDYVLVQHPSFLGFIAPNGDVQTADWDDEFGFRAEGGFRFENGIDVLARGARLNTEGSDREVDPGENMTVLVGAENWDDFDAVDVGFAEISFELDFEMADLESGKWFSIGDQVALRPFVALRYARFDYELDWQFCSDSGCSLAGDVETMDSAVEWWGVGILGGMEGQWRFLDRFTLFGRGGAGVLGGEYDSRALFRDADGGTPQQLLAREDGDLFVPVLEASVGLGVRLVDSDRFGLDLEAGYEVLTFFDSPQPFQGTADDIDNLARFDEETVTFHGAFVRLGLSF